MKDKNTWIKKGKFVEFRRNGRFGVGKIIKISGNRITIVDAPYTVRGKWKGRRIRLHLSEILGKPYKKRRRRII